MKGYIPHYSEFVEHVYSTLPPGLARQVLKDIKLIAMKLGNPLAVEPEDIEQFFATRRKGVLKSLRRYKSFVLKKIVGGDLNDKTRSYSA